MSRPEVFITLDQFKVLAARITAKENYIREKLEILLLKDTLDSTQCSLRLRDKLCKIFEDLKRPADSFFAVCKVDMQQPEKPQPTQMELFGKEFC